MSIHHVYAGLQFVTNRDRRVRPNDETVYTVIKSDRYDHLWDIEFTNAFGRYEKVRDYEESRILGYLRSEEWIIAGGDRPVNCGCGADEGVGGHTEACWVRQRKPLKRDVCSVITNDGEDPIRAKILTQLFKYPLLNFTDQQEIADYFLNDIVNAKKETLCQQVIHS